ncbi:MAG TPA: hypothetical protein VMW48_14285 [Vicinamibacterales bacterium]|nr:hypothetical protein [Vicinamibacterales bacterium]
MKAILSLAAALAVTAPLSLAAQTPGVDAQIASAVQILPDDLKAGATVVTYDAATGARKVLREGTNFLECQPTGADGFARCYNKVFAPRRDLEAKLRAEQKTDDEISAAVAAATKAGTLPAAPKAMMSYRHYGKKDRIQNLWVMSMPNATPESVGVSTESQRSAALEGRGLPWMMQPGKPGAHIMIPINPKPAKSMISDVAADPIAQATLPLPEDLRAGATVYTYDENGARKVLRQGTNQLECMPRGADDFTWCYNKVSAARRDFSAKLRAQKKTDKEISAAVEEATKAGTLTPTPFGTMSYRMYGKPDRIQLLWVLSVPDATPETIGVSTASQRTPALNHEGKPWLMLPGTPGAHIMIPINK